MPKTARRLGQIVRIRLPDEKGSTVGEVTGIGGPLVQVTAGGRVYYRHRNDL